MSQTLKLTQANQCILAGELEDLTGLEHPNRMAGRIKNEEILQSNRSGCVEFAPSYREAPTQDSPPVILEPVARKTPPAAKEATAENGDGRSGRRSYCEDPRPLDRLLSRGGGA